MTNINHQSSLKFFENFLLAVSIVSYDNPRRGLLAGAGWTRGCFLVEGDIGAWVYAYFVRHHPPFIHSRLLGRLRPRNYDKVSDVVDCNKKKRIEKR